MSYAGPASRASRAAATRPITSRTSTSQSGEPRPQLRAQTSTGREGRTTVFAAGMLLGLAIGAGITLLVAPQTGADVRRSLMKRGRRLRRRGVDAWDDLRDELQRAIRRRERSRRGALDDAED